ncbi:ankyrin repeat domain-containing protein [Candidatus Dependentiae bacterium]|nr:ankyrin repeat domain-containing protein [Candidatus Dependentiae bacterium]
MKIKILLTIFLILTFKSQCWYEEFRKNHHIKLLDYVMYLIRNNQDLNGKYYELDGFGSLLIDACRHDYEDIVELLLLFGADPNIREITERTPIYFVHDNDNIIHLLLKYGAGVNVKDCHGRSPIDSAKQWKYGKAIQILEKNFNNKQKNSLRIINKIRILKDFENKEKNNLKLFEAVQENNLLKLRFFLMQDFVNPNVQNELGETVLHVAVQLQNFEAIKYLLGYGANVWIKNKKGLTPIHYAVNRPEVLKFLIEFAMSQSLFSKLVNYLRRYTNLESFYSQLYSRHLLGIGQ